MRSLCARRPSLAPSHPGATSPRRWDKYTDAKQAIFFHTSTSHAPWMVIRSDDKAGRRRRRLACGRALGSRRARAPAAQKRARINTARLLLSSVPYGPKDPAVANQVGRAVASPRACAPTVAGRAGRSARRGPMHHVPPPRHGRPRCRLPRLARRRQPVAAVFEPSFYAVADVMQAWRLRAPAVADASVVAQERNVLGYHHGIDYNTHNRRTRFS